MPPDNNVPVTNWMISQHMGGCGRPVCSASPHCVQVDLHCFGCEWLRIPVVPPPFPKSSILLVRQIMGRALHPSPRSLGGHGSGGVSGAHCPDQVSPHWQNGYNQAYA